MDLLTFVIMYKFKNKITAYSMLIMVHGASHRVAKARDNLVGGGLPG